MPKKKLENEEIQEEIVEEVKPKKEIFVFDCKNIVAEGKPHKNRPKGFVAQKLLQKDIDFLKAIDDITPVIALKKTGDALDFLRKHDVKPGNYIIQSANGTFSYITDELFGKFYTK